MQVDPKKDELLDAGLEGRVDDVRLDHQVLIKKIGGIPVVGLDAADLRCGQKDNLRPLGPHPVRDLLLPGEVDFLAADRQQRHVLALKPPDDGRSGHASVARDPYALAFDVETQFLISACSFFRASDLEGCP